MNQFKYEVATELGINPEYKSGYWGNISSRECGAVGGHMVRRMIAAAQQSLVGQGGGTTGFRGNFPQETNQLVDYLTDRMPGTLRAAASCFIGR